MVAVQPADEGGVAMAIALPTGKPSVKPRPQLAHLSTWTPVRVAVR